MPSEQQVRIITIYTAGQSKTARRGIRLLACLSLLVAAVWLVEAAYPKKILGRWNTVDRWIKGRLMLAALGQSTDALGATQQDPWVALGLAPPQDAAPRSRPQDGEAVQKAYTQHMGVLVADFYLWKGIAITAGAWLALAALFGLAGRRPAARMHRQAARLMILSTLATVVGIYVAFRWGGMPPLAATLYAKIAAVQSAYAWFLLIAIRFIR